MLNFNKSTAKDEILQLLASEPGLFPKKIFQRISKQLPISYQAVHKALLNLQSQQVVSKDERGAYALDLNWLRQVKKFVNTAIPALAPSEVLDFRIIHFDTLSDVDDALIGFAEQHFGKGKRLCASWSHFWIPLFENQSTYSAMKKLAMASDGYSVTVSDSLIDRWCADYWKKLGVRVKTGVGYSGVDVFTYSDYVVEVFYSPDLRKKLDDFYNKAKTVRNLDLDGLYQNVFRGRTDLWMLIVHSPELANHIETEIMGYFK